MLVGYVTQGMQLPLWLSDVGDDDIQAVICHSSADLVKALPDLTAITMGEQSLSQASEWLSMIRQHVQLSSLPICHDGSHHDVTADFDGRVNSRKELISLVKPITERLASLPPLQETSSAELRLLHFLTARDQADISARMDWQDLHGYQFPIAKQFNPHHQDQWRWLQSLRGRGLLIPGDLVEKCHVCAYCRAAHLNYRELCPKCESVNIEEIPFLHCFSCGAIAAQEKFLSSGQLTCPKCHATLRHIGIDYDRPLESYLCRQCDAQFVDAKMSAHCLHCSAVMAPEKTSERPIYAFKLSELGRLTVYERANDCLSQLNRSNRLIPSVFYYCIDWLIAMQQQHTLESFCLVGVSRDAPPSQEVDAQSDDSWMDAVSKLLAADDKVMQDANNTLWLLLPKLTTAHVKKLMADIQAVPGLEDDNLRCVHYCSYLQKLADVRGEVLVGALRTELKS